MMHINEKKQQNVQWKTGFNLSQEVKINSDLIKQLKDNTRVLEETLTVNQYLVEEKVNTLKSQLRIIKK